MLNIIARVGSDLCPLRLPNEWLYPCAASTLPSVGLEICASCATRGTCIRTHLFPTPCREAAITGFGDHPNASITRCIAGVLLVLHFDPVLLPAAAVRPIAMLGDQSLEAKLAGLALVRSRLARSRKGRCHPAGAPECEQDWPCASIAADPASRRHPSTALSDRQARGPGFV